MGTVDLLGNIKFGRISLLGFVTIVIVWVCWILFTMMPPTSKRLLSIMWPFPIFIIWNLISLLWFKPTVGSMQTLLVLIAFTGLLILSGVQVYKYHYLMRRLLKALRQASWFAIVLYLFLRYVPLGFNMGPRSLTKFLLFGLAWYLATWRYGVKSSLWPVLVIIGIAGLTLSRSALGTSVLLVIVSRYRHAGVGSLLRMGILGSLLIALFIFSILSFKPLRERFFEGEMSPELRGISINMTGRVTLWSIMFESILDAPIVGKGVGSAKALIDKNVPGLDHPHNEYLRILHNVGAVGLFLWLLGYWHLFRTMWRAWQRADQRGDPAAKIYLSATLMLVANLLEMMTGNPLVYIFIMAPLGIMVGASIGYFLSKSHRSNRAIAGLGTLA